MLTGDDEVHLVAVESVGVRHGQQTEDHEAGDQEHWPWDHMPPETMIDPRHVWWFSDGPMTAASPRPCSSRKRRAA